MTTVTGIAYQRDPFSVTTLDCGLNCPADQWRSNSVQGQCGFNNPRTKPICSIVSSGICPRIGSTMPRGTFVYVPDRPINIFDTKPPVAVDCQYGITDFDTICDINTWKNSFGAQTNELNTNGVAAHYCSQDGMPNPNYICCTSEPTVNQCPDNTLPINGVTGIQMNKCSRFTSINAAGIFCKNWDGAVTGNNTSGKTISDNIKVQYCTANPDSQDCLCINRTKSSDYVNLKGNYTFNDGCWYLPCQANEQLKTSDIGAYNCPTNICQSIITNYENTGPINFNNINLATNCISGATGPVPIPTLSPSPSPTSSPVTTIVGFWDKYKTWIIVGIVIIVVIIIIIIIVAATSGSGKKTSKPNTTK